MDMIKFKQHQNNMRITSSCDLYQERTTQITTNETTT